MADNRMNYSMIIKNQENLINQLKRTIQVYENNIREQNRKISNHDSLVIEYNSFLKNYSELEKELNLAKNENMQLKNIINSKNQTISDYQKLVQESKSKFELFERNNHSLKLKIEELKQKLSNIPMLEQNNNELNLKLNEYENRIRLIKDEFNKKEELFNIKLANQEKLTKSNLRSYEDDIVELNSEIKNLKNQIQFFKRKNDEIISIKKSTENEYIIKLKSREKEIERLSNMISNLKTNMNSDMINNQSQMMNSKNFIEKLKFENSDLLKKLEENEAEITELNSALSQADDYIRQSDEEIKMRENTINSLIEEKDSLLNQLNEKQRDFNEYKNSTEDELNILNNKIASLEKEKNILINDNQNQRNEIIQLNDDINQYLNNDKIHFEECKQADQKYNGLAKSYKMKEKEYSEALAQLNVLNNNLRVELELIKSKYEKIIQDLMIKNNGLSERVKNLINSLIALKDYALSIERNMNAAQNFGYSTMFKNNNLNGNKNNSMILKNNNNSFMNEELGNSYNSPNLTYQGEFNNYSFEENNKKNRELLNSMKNMLNHIDTKIIDENGELME